MMILWLLVAITMFVSSKLVLYWQIQKAQRKQPNQPVNTAEIVLGDRLNLATFVTGIIGGALALIILLQMQQPA